MQLANKVVALTGAASGIGRACALELAQRGCRLVLVDRDAERLATIGDDVRARGATVATIIADLGDAAAVDRAARDMLDAFGGIDVLFSNAGVAVVKPLAETTDEDWQWVMNVNLWAPIRLVRAIAPAMAARGSGQIALTASVAGLVGAPGMLAYSTTKFALVGFAESLRAELAASNVGVTVICPGYVPSGLHRATRYANPVFERMLDTMPSWFGVPVDRAARRIADAIARRDPQLVFGVEKLGWYLKRLSPALGFAVTRWTAQRAGIV